MNGLSLSSPRAVPVAPTLRLRRLGIDTYQEPVAYMHRDCPVCRSEGFEAASRVLISVGGQSIIARLNVVNSDLVAPDEAGLSEAAWKRLAPREGASASFAHPPPLISLSHVRAKIYGRRLDAGALETIVQDVAAGRYSDIHLAAFLTACAANALDLDETIELTRAMVAAGERISWGGTPIVDKHSVGGLPGNRTTPIVVPIVAAAGLTMPKTSSRAITSPAGTADAMETIAPVDLDLDRIRRVVEREGGCIVWGGSVRLSPADDVLIRVERPLDLDSEAQLVASVLSKKIAAGSTHVVIDMPVGPTAKVRSAEAAAFLAERLIAVGEGTGIAVRVVEADGTQPVGRGVGPALEARDVLAVLRGEPGAPVDLRERALRLAGAVIDLGGAAEPGEGQSFARRILDEGRAWEKFERICIAQGGMREPPRAPLTHSVGASRSGRVKSIDNRRLAKAAKLAGAPRAAVAGLELHARLGADILLGEPLFTLHAETPGELGYAMAYVESNPDIFGIDETDQPSLHG